MSSSKRLASRNRTLTVLVDMDGVLADFEGHWLKIFRSLYPDEPFVPLEDRKTFYIDDQYDDRDKVNSIIGSEGFYESLPPIPGACEALKEMSGMENVDVFICSSPFISNYESCSAEKGTWIARHLGRDWLRKFVLTADKTVVHGDVLIDDKHRITGAMAPSWQHVVFTACHNRHINLKGRQRLDGWLPKENWRKLVEKMRAERLT